jgi:2-oxo-4-hydroxy-4-carboxy-5-ureidoimidazoline decarboxylase
MFMTTKLFSLQDLNALNQQEFTQALSPLFEGPPWIVAEAWHLRPFPTRKDLHNALCSVMYQAPLDKQIALLQSHPDLVGRAALEGKLSSASTSEQAAAGLDRLSAEEIATFTRFNQAYQERFGFPFVICARENKKGSILAGFTTRLGNHRDQEIAQALREVEKICALRLQDLVREEENEA